SALPSERAISAFPLPTRSASASTNVTCRPARAQTSTMPEPMRPQPTTPTFRTSSAFIAIPSSPLRATEGLAGKTIRTVIAALVQRLIDLLAPLYDTLGYLIIGLGVFF